MANDAGSRRRQPHAPETACLDRIARVGLRAGGRAGRRQGMHAHVHARGVHEGMHEGMHEPSMHEPRGCVNDGCTNNTNEAGRGSGLSRPAGPAGATTEKPLCHTCTGARDEHIKKTHQPGTGAAGHRRVCGFAHAGFARASARPAGAPCRGRGCSAPDDPGRPCSKAHGGGLCRLRAVPVAGAGGRAR